MGFSINNAVIGGLFIGYEVVNAYFCAYELGITCHIKSLVFGMNDTTYCGLVFMANIEANS